MVLDTLASLWNRMLSSLRNHPSQTKPPPEPETPAHRDEAPVAAATSLLERLRSGSGAFREGGPPLTSGEAREKATLLLAHRSEFPAKLRDAIAEANEGSEYITYLEEETFLDAVAEAWEDFFAAEEDEQHLASCTEDQAELARRVFRTFPNDYEWISW